LSSESAKGFNVSTSDIAAILFHADCLLDERCRFVEHLGRFIERLGRFTTSLTAGASADGSNGLGISITTTNGKRAMSGVGLMRQAQFGRNGRNGVLSRWHLFG
jgi:hypothetical protein